MRYDKLKNAERTNHRQERKMTMKKILAAALSLMLVTGLFAACGKNNTNNPNNGGNTTNQETTNSGVTEGTILDTIPEENMGTGLSEAMNSIAEAVEGAVEWPAMVLMTDAATLKDFFLLDAENPNYKEVMVKQAAMSAAFGEIIVIEAVDGKVDEAVKDLEARKQKLIDQDAFYPEHQELAQNAIVGKKGNYAYLLAGQGAADAEKALIEKLPA